MKWENVSEKNIIHNNHPCQYRPYKVNPVHAPGRADPCSDPGELRIRLYIPCRVLPQQGDPTLVSSQHHLCTPQHLPAHSCSPEILPNTCSANAPSLPGIPVHPDPPVSLTLETSLFPPASLEASSKNDQRLRLFYVTPSPPAPTGTSEKPFVSHHATLLLGSRAAAQTCTEL